MSPQIIAETIQNAEKFVALAKGLNEIYPTYIDGRCFEHYVPGSGTRQVREAAERLRDTILSISWFPACTLPRIHAE